MSLIENTLFGIENKIEKSIARLKEFEPPAGYWLAFSGGKDSVVILDLAKKSGVKFEAHFNLTSVDPKEVIQFTKQNYPEVILDRPKINMWDLIVKNKMPPTQLIRYCCRYLKERGGTGRFTLTGVRWEESFKRSKRKMVETCMREGVKQYLHPIIDWTEKEVWEYIRSNKLSYCSLYDEGFKRIGCIGCPMGSTKQREAQFERWPGYKRAYINTFAKITTPKHPTGEEWFNWWLYRRRNDKNKDQSIMFE